MKVKFKILVYILIVFSCVSNKNVEIEKLEKHTQYVLDDSVNNPALPDLKDSGISLKRNGNSLIEPFQKLNSLDSSIVYYKAHFPYSEEFKKYSDTGKYDLYVLKYKDLDSLYQNTNGQMGVDIYLSVEETSNRIVGIEGRWAFYVDPSDSISVELISYVQNTFFPDLSTDIEAKANWYYQIESQRHQEHIKFIDFKKSPMGNLELPVVSYIVEF